VNVATQILPRPAYLVTLTRACGGEAVTTTLATVPSAGLVPSWVHSFALASEDILVLVEAPCRYNFPAIMGLDGGPLPQASHVCMDWYGHEPTRVHVIPLKQPEEAAVHELPTFFAFHMAQAVVRPAGQGTAACVDLDLCAYEDLEVLDALRLPRLLSGDGPLLRRGRSRLLRVSLPLPGAAGKAVSFELCDGRELGGFCDFPQVCRGGGGDSILVACLEGPASAANCLARVDPATGAVRRWAGSSAAGEELIGECVVVPAPHPSGGSVALVPCHGPSGGSLAVLDAESLEELARVRPSRAVPYGVHGQWIPDGNG